MALKIKAEGLNADIIHCSHVCAYYSFQCILLHILRLKIHADVQLFSIALLISGCLKPSAPATQVCEYLGIASL